jgi:hypothetical protein
MRLQKHLWTMSPIHREVSTSGNFTRRGSNIDRWTTGLTAWEKRVHLTNMLEKASGKACSVYDFEKVAAQLGRLMTIDGSGDELIKLQGLGHVTFGEEDGGDPLRILTKTTTRVRDEEPVSSGCGGGGGGGAPELGSGDEEDEVVLNDTDSDEEDDTAEVDATAVAGIETFEPPDGYTIDTSPLANENDVIGRKVALKWDGAPLEARISFGMLKLSRGG